jgi:hypothetical protein
MWIQRNSGMETISGCDTYIRKSIEEFSFLKNYSLISAFRDLFENSFDASRFKCACSEIIFSCEGENLEYFL